MFRCNIITTHHTLPSPDAIAKSLTNGNYISKNKHTHVRVHLNISSCATALRISTCSCAHLIYQGCIILVKFMIDGSFTRAGCPVIWCTAGRTLLICQLVFDNQGRDNGKSVYRCLVWPQNLLRIPHFTLPMCYKWFLVCSVISHWWSKSISNLQFQQQIGLSSISTCRA